MHLTHKPSGELVEVLNLDRLFNPLQSQVCGRFLAGAKLQELAAFDKDDLLFPTGENLPRCWVSPAHKFKLHIAGGRHAE